MWKNCFLNSFYISEINKSLSKFQSESESDFISQELSSDFSSGNISSDKINLKPFKNNIYDFNNNQVDEEFYEKFYD